MANKAHALTMNKFSILKTIRCRHYGLCSGCTLQDDVAFPPVANFAKIFFDSQGISSFPVISDSSTGWRCRAKLAVRGSYQNILIGLYKENTHEVMAIPFCEIHYPKINEAVDLVRQVMQSEKIDPYNEDTFQGVVRYLQFAIERSSGRVQTTLVLNVDSLSEKALLWIEKLWDIGKKNLWHSLWVNFNVSRTNIIFGKEWFLCYGESLLWETFCQTKVCFHPGSFAQANLNLFEKMVSAIQCLVHPGARVVDYYSGVGVIGLCLAEHSLRVDCCEINPLAKECFERSRVLLPEQVKNRVHFHEGSVVEHLDILHDAEIVVVDPPRKGLDPALMKILKDSKNQELIYVSCGWQGFQRDCDILLRSGWKLRDASGYVFFPGSNYLEVLARFIKS